MNFTLPQLQEKLKTWDGCILSQSANLVLGEGNSHADIMFIGEAPGAKEDQLGRPFVGASGKLLDALLSSIHLQREDVYITNVVKYRPPYNRDPLLEEKEVCLPWLMQEIAIVGPKVICTLGNHSLHTFFPEINISSAHGQVQSTSDGHIIFPMYHPAAALYNGGLREKLFDDFRKLKEFLQSE